MERQRLRSHLSGTVPISIAVHVAVILVVVIIPLTAVDVSLLMVPVRIPDYMAAVPVPPLPVTRPLTARATARPAPDVNLAPTAAPPSIAAEVPGAAAVSDVPVPDMVGGIGGDTGGLGNLGRAIVLPAPEPPRPAGPVRIADLPVPPRKIVDVRAVYPEIARQARAEGIVVLEAVLDPTGAVTQVHVVRSVPLLDQAALDAVRQWRYTPTRYGGRPVSVLMTITIRFTLHE